MTLEVRNRGGVCELHLDAPPGNILDRALCKRLDATLTERATDPRVKAFLFTAEGKHFSYGASVAEHVTGEVESFLPAFHRLCRTLAGVPVPTIAAVRGLCLGGACEVVSLCNLVVAEESARFGVPEIRLGVFPPVACVTLPGRVGRALAEDLILTGRRIEAAEAARAGLVSRLCPDGALEETVHKLLDEQILPLSAASLRVATKAVRAPLREELRDRLHGLEHTYLMELMATRDAHEGVQAFLDKREPTWTDA